MSNVMKAIIIGIGSISIFELGGIVGEAYALGVMKKYKVDADSVVKSMSDYNGKGKRKRRAAFISDFAKFVAKEKGEKQ